MKTIKLLAIGHKIMGIVVLIIGLSTNSVNGQQVSKTSKLHNTVKINASAEKVWDLLGNLSGCSEWIPGVVSAKVEADKRTCTTADNKIIIEKISKYSKKTMSFSYSHLQSPMPVKDSKGTFKVKKDGDGALVTWDASFEVLDQSQKDAITKMLNGYYVQSLESLKKVIEAK